MTRPGYTLGYNEGCVDIGRLRGLPVVYPQLILVF